MAILYADRRDRRKSPGVPGAGIAIGVSDNWHVRYRRLNSSAFAKCVRSCDFLRSMLRIAGKVNQSGWAIISHDFSKLPSMEPGNKIEVPHHRDRRKKSPGMSTSVAAIACDFRWRSNSPRSAYEIARARLFESRLTLIPD